MRPLPLLVLGAVVALAGCHSAAPDARPDASPAPSATPTTAPTSAAPAGPAATSEGEQAALDRRLLAAAWDDDVAAATRLVDRGADVNTQDGTQQSAYLVATSEGHLELLELTLAHGADVDARDRFDGTGLIRAAERGHADVVGRLVRTGVPLDHVNRLGWTALNEAVVLGDGGRRHHETVRVLVAAGADVADRSPRDGRTPYEQARDLGHERSAGLLDRARRIDAREPDRAAADQRLLTAAAVGDADDVALALRQGARIETRDDRDRTPLLLASAGDHVAVARLLVALGADPDALDDRHDTPWLVTGVTGSVAMLETLLPADPDLTVRNPFGGLSVIPASERGHAAYVRRVVRTGIDVDHVNDLGWTAMLEAVVLGDGSPPYQEIVRTLLDAGADASIADRDGRTPLQVARTRGQDEVAALLDARVNGR